MFSSKNNEKVRHKVYQKDYYYLGRIAVQGLGDQLLDIVLVALEDHLISSNSYALWDIPGLNYNGRWIYNQRGLIHAAT